MSTSTSDHDMSDSSSPVYNARYSPNSSPSQQVPQIVSGLHELSCVDKRQFLKQGGGRPFLRITEQPQNHFRFRYVSEMIGTHGCLLGKSCGPNKTKTHPAVELVNYTGEALIRCRLAQSDNDEEHPHKLLEDEQDRDLSYHVPEQGSYKVGFGGIGIIHTAKKGVAALLYKNMSEKMGNTNFNPKDLQAQCESMAKNINLNIVRLKFSAHDIVTGQEICEPVFSEPIHNMKSAATNDLKICRISRSSGSASGREDVFILVEKVNKKNIIIRFFELDENGTRVWHSDGSFVQSDVHHQYAIVFRTPPYKNPETTKDVNVFIELVRPSDGRTSEPKEFKYKKNQVCAQFKKRKANSSYSSIGSSSSGSLTSCDIPITVMNQHNDVNKAEDVLRDVIMRDEAMKRDVIAASNYLVPQVPQVADSACDLGEALYGAAPGGSPMWGARDLPLVHLRSGELEDIGGARQEPNMQQYLTEYLKSFGDSIDEKNNSMEFFRSLLMTDSGRAKPKDQQVEPQMDTRPTYVALENDTKKMKTEYPAFYKTEDGVEVKQIVKDICDMMRNKKGFKKQEVRNKLERLFEIRLSNGDTFLHMTLCSNEPTVQYIVKIIHTVKATYLLDCANDKQQTTLHLAIINDMPKMVALLIAKGASPMVKDDEDLNAVHYAVKYRSCLDTLLEAIKKNEVPCDLNDCNNEKQSALHMAVVEDCAKSVKLLMSHGASYSVRDAMGRTPLHLAAYDNRLHVMKTLLEFIPPSEIDVTDGAGNTALQIVCSVGPTNENTLEIAKLLLDKKANPILKQEDSNNSAWRLVADKPALKELLHKYVVGELMDEDVKSEPEDEYESADEGDGGEGAEGAEGGGLSELSAFGREVSVLVDVSGAWRALARRLRLDALLDWYAAQPSPTLTLLKHLKDSRDDITSKSLALILEDMGQTEAASVIRRYLD